MNGIFIHQQIKALQELGCECHVLMDFNWFPPFGLHKYHSYWNTGYSTFHNYFEEVDGIKIHRVSTFIKMPNRLLSDNYYDRLANSFSNYIKKNSELSDADWIYAHFLTDFGFIGTKVKEKTRIKLAAIARGDDVHAWPLENPKLLPHITKVFIKADILFANSGRLAQDANSLVSKEHRRTIEVVYNGIDLEKFRPASISEKNLLREKYGLKKNFKYFICVATPVELKGWLLLFDAFAAVRQSLDNWKLLCVAVNRKSSDTLDLSYEAEKRGLRDFVEILGQVSHDKMAEYYRSSDVFILPSYNEGMANALLEAAASNIHLIATDVGGHSEIFEDSEDCSLIKPGDLGRLEEAILKAINFNENSCNTRAKVLKVGSYLDNSKKLLQKLLNSNNLEYSS